MQCKRQPGGEKALVHGVCPAAIDTTNSGVNGGKNAGRYCWRIVGTVCGGRVQGDTARKIGSCMVCAFLKLVIQEEGRDFVG